MTGEIGPPAAAPAPHPPVPDRIVFVPPDEWAVCVHEAGHAAAALVVGVPPAFMEIIDGPPPHGRNRIPHVSGPPRRLVAVGGYAAELALFHAGRLVDADGAGLDQKAFIDRAIGSNADLDKAAFFSGDRRGPDGRWSEADDREFMELGEGLQSVFPVPQVLALASALMAERVLDTERIVSIWNGMLPAPAPPPAHRRDVTALDRGATASETSGGRGLQLGSSDHLVILVHGIRTHAFWYDRLKRLFEGAGGVTVEGAKYGRFDLFRFLVPGPWRRTPVEKVGDKIRPLVVAANAASRKVTVIAHSNGTQVATRILREDPLFHIDNLIMCGSVVDDDYDWWLVRDRVRGLIVNDYGVRDVWPAVARSVSWGYGYSGTVGFGTPVVDRIHDGGHSDYFTDDFMRRYWLPLVTDGVLVQSPPLAVDGGGRPWWFDVFELPLRWILPLLAAALVALAVVGAGRTHGPQPPHPRPPSPAPGPAWTVVDASYQVGDRWLPVDVYGGAARNWLQDSSLRVVGGGGDVDSFDGGVPDAPADVGTEPSPQGTVGGVLARYGVASRANRSELRRCMASAALLARCPDRIKAAALDLLQVPAFEGDPQLDGIGERLRDFQGGAALATASADVGDDPVVRLHLTLRNGGRSDRLLTGIKLRLREVFYAQGDGSVGEQPVALQPQSAGTVQLRRLFLADCSRPSAVPAVEVALPGPVPVRAGGANLIELGVDTSSRRRASADVVDFEGMDDAATEPVAARCAAMRASRARTLAAFPGYAEAFQLLMVPMFDSNQNSAIEVSVRDDLGNWTVLGTLNFALP